jgi:hypothetical protein
LFIPDPDPNFFPSRIPDPVVKKAPDPGSAKNTGFKAYVVSASTKHADIPHILFDYHAEGGSKKLEKLDSKAVLSIRNYSLFIRIPEMEITKNVNP